MDKRKNNINYIFVFIMLFTILFSASVKAEDTLLVQEGVDFDSDIVYNTSFGTPTITVENETNYRTEKVFESRFVKECTYIVLPKNTSAKISVDYGIVGTVNSEPVKLKLTLSNFICAEDPRLDNTNFNNSLDAVIYRTNEMLIRIADNPQLGYFVSNTYLCKVKYDIRYEDGTLLENPVITFGSISANSGPDIAASAKEGVKPINVNKVSTTDDSIISRGDLVPCIYSTPNTNLTEEETHEWYYSRTSVSSDNSDWVYNPLTGKVDKHNPKVAISAFYSDSSNMQAYVTSKNGDTWQNAYVVVKAPHYNLKIKKTTPESIGDNQTFNFKLKAYKEVTIEEKNIIKDETPEEGQSNGQAYAVFDSTNGVLTFFRDEENKYTNNQTIDSKTYYTGFENRAVISSYGNISSQNPFWVDKNPNITRVVFADTIIPDTTDKWFYNASNLTTIENIENLKMHKVLAARNMFNGCSSLTELDTSNFYMPSCRFYGYMFKDCDNLEYLDLSYLYFEEFLKRSSDSQNMGAISMFENCRKLSTELTIPAPPVTITNMFKNAATEPGSEIKLKTYRTTSFSINKMLTEAGPNSNITYVGSVDSYPCTPPDAYGNQIQTQVVTETHPIDLIDDERFEYDLDTQTYSFTLQGNEEVIIEDVPKGYKYEIEEVDIPSGWKNISKSNDSGSIDSDTTSEWINTPLTNITVYKQWNDNGKTHTAADITGAFSLFQNGTRTTEYNDNVTVTNKGDGCWEYKVTNLPKYDVNLELYVYRVVETNIPNGYKVNYPNPNSFIGNMKAAANGEIITNYNSADLSIEKETVRNESGSFNFDVTFTGPNIILPATQDTNLEVTKNIFEPIGNIEENIILEELEEYSGCELVTSGTKRGFWLTLTTLPSGFVPDEATVTAVTLHGDDTTTDLPLEVKKVGDDILIGTDDIFALQSPLSTTDKFRVELGYEYQGHAFLARFTINDFFKIADNNIKEFSYDASSNESSYVVNVNSGSNYTFQDIPTGTSYSVSEKNKSGWKNVSSTNASGTLTADTTSKWVNEKLYTLKVSNNVKGNLGDKIKEFEYTVNITGLEPGCTYTHSNGAFTAGSNGETTIVFHLKDDEEWVLNNLPYNSKVTVTEAASNHTASYKVNKEGSIISTGANIEKEEPLTINELAIDNDVSIEFTNTRELEPITAAASSILWLFVLVLLVMSEIYIGSKHRKMTLVSLHEK